MNKLMTFTATALAFVFLAGSAHASSAPSIGGGAQLSVSIGKAGVLNAGAAIEGKATVKQAVGSIISGSIGGTLKDNVSIGEAGVVNAGAAIEGAATICQSVGSIGSDCSDSLTGN